MQVPGEDKEGDCDLSQSLLNICQLNNSIQTNIHNVQTVLFTDLQVQVDQAQAQIQAQACARAQEPNQVYFGPLFYNQDGLTGQYHF